MLAWMKKAQKYAMGGQMGKKNTSAGSVLKGLANFGKKGRTKRMANLFTISPTSGARSTSGRARKSAGRRRKR